MSHVRCCRDWRGEVTDWTRHRWEIREKAQNKDGYAQNKSHALASLHSQQSSTVHTPVQVVQQLDERNVGKEENATAELRFK